MKLQIAVSRASLIFQKRFPDAVNTRGRLYIASTACTRSHIATTKQKIIISKIRKKCPLKSSYVAPRVLALVDMTAGTINSVVPNDLQQARRVGDIDSARRQIEDMVDIIGRNMTAAISDAAISPSERAYLYMKVQDKLKYELESVKDLVRLLNPYICS